jgi:hypothetical protein
MLHARFGDVSVQETCGPHRHLHNQHGLCPSALLPGLFLTADTRALGGEETMNCVEVPIVPVLLRCVAWVLSLPLPLRCLSLGATSLWRIPSTPSCLFRCFDLASIHHTWEREVTRTTMLAPTTLLTLGLAALLVSRGAAAQEVECWAPDGETLADNTTYVPCNKLGIQQEGVYSSCCNLDGKPGERDLCTTTGLCLNGGVLSRGYCTDKNWDSPACVKVCTDDDVCRRSSFLPSFKTIYCTDTASSAMARRTAQSRSRPAATGPTAAAATTSAAATQTTPSRSQRRAASSPPT